VAVPTKIQRWGTLNATPDCTAFLLQFMGTSEEAKLHVRQYFAELQEALKRQEVAALTVVDTHVRERLCMLRQQQEDMTVLLSQVSAVCHQCERTLQQVLV